MKTKEIIDIDQEYDVVVFVSQLPWPRLGGI